MAVTELVFAYILHVRRRKAPIECFEYLASCSRRSIRVYSPVVSAVIVFPSHVAVKAHETEMLLSREQILVTGTDALEAVAEGPANCSSDEPAAS